MDELRIDLDILTWALERVGGDDCPFASMTAGAPDHHGREFAAALFEAIKAEREEYDLLLGANKAGYDSGPTTRIEMGRGT